MTKADSSTVSTLSTKVNTIEDTVDGHTQSLQSVTSTQTSIQQNAVKSTVQLWFTKADTTAPNKPTAHVTTNNASTANAWNLAVPTFNKSYPNYFYCYEYQKGDNTYAWSDVVFDKATTENQANSRQALDYLENTIDVENYNTFKQTTTATNSAVGEIIKNLGTNADGTTKEGDTFHRVSTIEQDLEGFHATVEQNYATKTESLISNQNESNPLILDDAGNAKLLSFEAKGWAEQDGTTGKNLRKPTERTVSSNGVTYSVASDGKVTLSGNATGRDSFNLFKDQTIENGTYTVSLHGNERTYLSPTTAVITNGTLNGVFGVWIESGITYDESFYVQLELGSTATSYEPYTGGKPSPSPDYPQEIRVARGRNLLDWNDVDMATAPATTILDFGEDRTFNALVLTFVMDGFSASNVNAGIINFQKGDGTNYWITPANYGCVNNTAYSDTRAFVLTNITFCKVMYPKFVTYSGRLSLQLELGSTPTPYVPYGHVGLEVQGKNLFGGLVLARAIQAGAPSATIDEDAGTITYLANEVSDDVWFGGFEEGKTYTVFFCIQSGYNNYAYRNRAGQTRYFNAPTVMPDGNTVARVSTSDISALTGSWYGGNTTLEYNLCGIFEGDVSWDDFEPYHHTTTPIPLPSKGWAGSLPDGTVDKLSIDWTGKVTWENETSGAYFDDLVWIYGDNRMRSGSLQDVISRPTTINDVPKLLAEKYVALPWTTQLNSRHDAVACNKDNGQLVCYGGNDADYPTGYALYALADPTTEELGRIEMPEVFQGATVSIPELDGYAATWWTKNGNKVSLGLDGAKTLIEETEESLQTSIDQTATAIRTEVAEATDGITTRMTSMTQDIEGITVAFDEFSESTQNDLNALSSLIRATTDSEGHPVLELAQKNQNGDYVGIRTEQSSTTKEVKLSDGTVIQRSDGSGTYYFRPEFDSQGHVVGSKQTAAYTGSGAIIGDAGAMHLSLTDDQMGFVNGTQRVAYIDIDPDTNEGLFHITNIVVVNELRIGEWKWFRRRNGHLSLRWDGSNDEG